MSKYDALWKYVSEAGKDSFKLTYAENNSLTEKSVRLIYCI